MKTADLSSFTAKNFDKGAGFIKQTLWYFVNALLVRASWNPFMGIKIALLKLFGAKIGKGLVLKNNVCIKFPWKLTVGDNVWIGEYAWIDNLDKVTIGNNVCISQGALLLTGNGVTMKSHAILTVGSIATKSLEAYGIYQGNPAKKIRERIIK